MLDVQERVARLEGRVEGHAQMLTDVAAAVRHLEGRMEQRFTALEEKFDRKLDETFGTIDRRIDRLEAGFLWMIGIQFATLIAVVGAAIVG